MYWTEVAAHLRTVRRLTAAQNEILRLSGLLRVANTERNDAVKLLRDIQTK